MYDSFILPQYIKFLNQRSLHECCRQKLCFKIESAVIAVLQIPRKMS